MAHSGLRFEVNGPDARVAAARLAEILAEGFDCETRVVAPSVGEVKECGQRGVDLGTAAAVTACILALPSAVQSTIDLAERFRLRERVERTIAAVKEQLQELDVEVSFVVAEHAARRLDEVRLDELLDVLIAAKEGGNKP